MYRFVINKRYVNLLRAIARPGDHDVAGVSKESGIAYSRISSYISEFAKEGIVKKEPLNMGPGMRIKVSITTKGKEIIGCFDKIDEIMKKEVEKEVEDGEN